MHEYIHDSIRFTTDWFPKGEESIVLVFLTAIQPHTAQEDDFKTVPFDLPRARIQEHKYIGLF